MPEAAFHEIQGSAASPDLGERLPRFMGLDGDAVAILQRGAFGVIGNGAVGRELALHLARLQPGALWLCDRGRYKPQSLLTQPVTPDEVGEPKASSTGRLCKALSPRTAVFVCDGEVQDLPAIAFADVDVVALATDNLAAEVEVGQRCLWLCRPLVQASVHGATLVAQVRSFANRNGAGPCPACGFSAEEWAHLNRETSFSCKGAASGRIERRTAVVPTMSVSFLCALAANLASVQLLRHVLKLGAPLTDSLVEYCGYTHRTVTAPLTRNPDCVCDHTAWERRPAPAPLRDCTPARLAEAAGLPVEEVSYAVDGLTFAELVMCKDCGRSQPGGRFVGAGQSSPECARGVGILPALPSTLPSLSNGRLEAYPTAWCAIRASGPCADCGGMTRAEPFYSHDPVPAVLLPTLTEALARLGAGGARWVIVRGRERAVLFRGDT